MGSFALAALLAIAPAQRQAHMNASASVCMVDLKIRAEGEFIRSAEGQRVGADQVALLVFGGSAVAVSADGHLLTNRHVVDPRYFAAVACKSLVLEDYSSATISSLRIDYSFSDISREPVSFGVTVKPKGGDADICTDPMHAAWYARFGDQSGIAAMDEHADLALVRLDVSGIPFLGFGGGAVTAGDRLIAFGYDRHDALIRAEGPLVSPCSPAEEEDVPGDVIFLPTPQPLMKVKAAIRSGMSGGALVSGGALAGMTVLGEGECEEDAESCDEDAAGGYAIPAPYLEAWYRWALGNGARPGKVCELPEEK